MSWINKIIPTVGRSAEDGKGKNKINIPEGLWKKCPRCDSVLYHDNLKDNLDVCPKCDHHLRISARRRLEIFLDPESAEEIAGDIKPTDILKFRDLKKYKDRLAAATKATGENDALVVQEGTLQGRGVVVAAFEFAFIGGSMGSVVGEKFVQGVNRALARNVPFVCFATSGGARMQEALVSLMQMAKTSAALERLKSRGQLYVSVLVDPVYGGVSASLAMLGDINIAEPNAFIGFAGQDVIRQTVREKLPEGFQRSEFLLEHGAIDMILHRKDLRGRIASLINKFMPMPETNDLFAAAAVAAEEVLPVEVDSPSGDEAAPTQEAPEQAQQAEASVPEEAPDAAAKVEAEDAAPLEETATEDAAETSATDAVEKEVADGSAADEEKTNERP